MSRVSRKDINAFGNPSAYHENRLYRLFCEQGKEASYYLIQHYGLDPDGVETAQLNSGYRRMLSKVYAHQRVRFKAILRHIHEPGAAALWLDLGCGYGQFVEAIARTNPRLVVGADVTFGVLSWAGRLLKNRIPLTHYALVRQGESGLPFKDGCFDRILSADVLEHVGYDNQKQVLSEMYRVLKHCGKVIVHTPNLNRVRLTTVFKKAYYGFKGYNPFSIKHSFRLDHNSLSTAARLKKICEEIGFHVEVYYELGLKFYDTHRWIVLGLDRFLARSFFLVLSKQGDLTGGR
jgi:ubiquinone/menaquinone biosynthesis C-methylase UbiE